MLYELRMYHAGPGRLDDIATRMRDQVPALFAKHNFVAPLGQWRAVAGAKLPMYVWILAWPDSEYRAQAFASLYGDPDWQQLRVKTNGSREMVLAYDIAMMRDTPAGAAARQLHADRRGPARGLHELRLHQIYPGRAGQANATLSQTDLPALKRAGATTLGVFDIQSGPVTPGFAHFLAWDGFDARTQGLRAFEADEGVSRARAAEADELKTYVVGRYDSWLLEPTDFCPPNFGFEPHQ